MSCVTHKAQFSLNHEPESASGSCVPTRYTSRDPATRYYLGDTVPVRETASLVGIHPSRFLDKPLRIVVSLLFHINFFLTLYLINHLAGS